MIQTYAMRFLTNLLTKIKVRWCLLALQVQNSNWSNFCSESSTWHSSKVYISLNKPTWSKPESSFNVIINSFVGALCGLRFTICAIIITIIRNCLTLGVRHFKLKQINACQLQESYLILINYYLTRFRHFAGRCSRNR